LEIGRIEALPDELGELVAVSLDENFRAVERLRAEWDRGSNRFLGPGEALFEARLSGQLVAICGLNTDPFAADATLGRLRHLYVVPGSRLRGVGRALVSAVLLHAQQHFRTVRLRSFGSDADRFYVALGFERIAANADATHQIQLTSEPSTRSH